MPRSSPEKIRKLLSELSIMPLSAARVFSMRDDEALWLDYENARNSLKRFGGSNRAKYPLKIATDLVLDDYTSTDPRRFLLGEFVASSCPIYSPDEDAVSRLWWRYIKSQRTVDAFPEITQESIDEVQAIREHYLSRIADSGISEEEFFGGSIKDQEAFRLFQMVRNAKPRVSLQIGTFVGYSTCIIARALALNGGGRLVTIDPDIAHRSVSSPVGFARGVLGELSLKDFVGFERGWSSVAMAGGRRFAGAREEIPVVGPEVVSNIDQGIDFCFIDGDHSTCATIADFLLVRDAMNPAGSVLFHDVFSWPTVAQALAMIWNDVMYADFSPDSGEFCVGESGKYWDLDVISGFDGLGVLMRKPDDSERVVQEM